MWELMFFVNAILLGIGLAMDAFSVSLANGLNEPCMKKSKITLISLVFAFFQAAMPLIGWLCIHTIATVFNEFTKFIPWIALILLSYIGGKMLYDGIKNKECECECGCNSLKIGSLIVQGIATSIDALSVGFTIAEQDFIHALVTAGLIGFVTFFICFAGIFIGKIFGTKISNKATIFGGIILILIGLEIFLDSMLG